MENLTPEEVLSELFVIMDVPENGDIRDRARTLMEKEWMLDSLEY